MYAIKAIYDGTNFKLMQPIPVKEAYEVVITFLEPVKNDQVNIMKYFGSWEGEDAIDLQAMFTDRENFSALKI